VSKPTTVGIGPFTGVWDTGEPFDDATGSRLADALNVYFPNCEQGSGAYARPGINTPYSITHGSLGKPQGAHTMRALDGTVYNFLFIGGKVWRVPTNLTSSPVDVTPTGVVISSAARYIFATTLADQMIVNDGVNKPFVCTNLGSTPITATYIEQQTPSVLLSRGASDFRLANAAFTYTRRTGGSIGQQATQAESALGTTPGALGTIPIGLWASIRVEFDTATAAFVFTAASGIGAGYASEALAIAALPARTVTRWDCGYVTVQAGAGTTWICGTDAFAGGATGNPAQTTNYYAGEGPTWSAFGKPVIYTGAVFFICQQVETTYARTTITWSEPNLPSEGYQQTDYDNAWTLTQTGSDPLYVLQPTNDALYYFRQLSIGQVSGAPGVNFAGTATHDVVSMNVGCAAAAGVAMTGNVIYFVDQVGRPWRFVVGGIPEPIWKQCRRQFEVYTGSVSGFEFVIIEPTINVAVFGTWPLFSFADGYTFGSLYVFDAQTGTYFGVWQWSTPNVVGRVSDLLGNPRLVFMTDTVNATIPVFYLGTPIPDAVWTDSGAVPSISVTLGWLGYDGSTTFRANEARVMQSSTTTTTMTVTPVAAAATTSNRAPVGMIHTHTGRSVFSLDAPVGRGVSLKVSPTTAAAQWKCYRVEADLMPDGRATVEDY
jgi:hypothetical protein